MAGEDRRSTADLKDRLLSNPRPYSFFQAVRLLRLITDPAGVESYETLFQNRLRVRTLLSLSFPGSDVHRIEETSQGDEIRFLLTATFLGLYGAASPLPTHYTEDLLDEASEDHTVTRDFLDLLGDPYYRLFYQAWTRNRWFIKLTDENDQVFLDRLFCLLGLGLDEFRRAVRGDRRLLRYIGLFSQFPRSAMGLRTLLADAVDVPNVDVIPNVSRQVRIPEDQRFRLGVAGCTLGEDGCLGRSIEDRMGKIRIQAGPLDADKFHSLLPGADPHREVNDLTSLYLSPPLERELELILDQREARTVSLGEPRWALLGYDTWLFSGPTLDSVASVRFDLSAASQDMG